MMNKQYKPKDIEKRIYENWEKNQSFSPKESTSKFSIVLPPPNVTGTLHMGHAFQHTIIDVLVRYHRMLGKSVLWQPGTDHAGIATQLVVENRLSSLGTDINNLSRDEFISEVWKWKDILLRAAPPHLSIITRTTLAPKSGRSPAQRCAAGALWWRSLLCGGGAQAHIPFSQRRPKGSPRRTAAWSASMLPRCFLAMPPTICSWSAAAWI